MTSIYRRGPTGDNQRLLEAGGSGAGSGPGLWSWRWLGMDHYPWTIVLFFWTTSMLILQCVRLFNNSAAAGAVSPQSYDIWFFVTQLGLTIICFVMTNWWAANDLLRNEDVYNKDEESREAMVSGMVALAHDRNFLTVSLVGSLIGLILAISLVVDPEFGNNDLAAKLTDMKVLDFTDVTTVLATFRPFIVAKLVELADLNIYFVMIVAFLFNYTSLPLGLYFSHTGLHGRRTDTGRQFMGANANADANAVALATVSSSKDMVTVAPVGLSPAPMGTAVRLDKIS